MGNCCMKATETTVLRVRESDKQAIRHLSITQNSPKRRQSYNIQLKKTVQVSKENIFKFFKFQEILGISKFGCIVKSISLNDPDTQFVINSIEKSSFTDTELLNFKSSMSLLTNIESPNIIKLFQFNEDLLYLHLVTEFCTGGNLIQRISSKKHYSELEVCSVVLKIVSAIEKIHEVNLFHGNLKAEYILFESKNDFAELKIINSGLPWNSEKDIQKSICSSLVHLPPEIINKQKPSKANDIWSIGFITYVILSGKQPFEAKTTKLLFNKILNYEISFENEIWENISENAKNFINCCMKKSPDVRSTTNQLLNHAWLSKTKFENILGTDIVKSVKRNLKTYYSPIEMQNQLVIYLSKTVDNFNLKAINEYIVNNVSQKSNYIKGSEFVNVLRKLNQEENSKEVFEIIRKYKCEEWDIEYMKIILSVLNRKKEIRQCLLWEEFKTFDTNNTNKIDATEIENYQKNEKSEKIMKYILDNEVKELYFEDYCKICDP